ncbi:MAG: amidohydrolase family protein [Bryobacterales bacterium]|nr:amidohydrolase family protein [Bryobacterales bacterium]
MKSDSHHHFWRYSQSEYGWIHDGMRTIRRSFLPLDLEREIAEVGIDGVVSVQARQTLSETEDLLAWAQEHDFIRGVVGWVPLVSGSVREEIERFADRDELKGVRHVLQSEPDNHYMLRDDFNRGVALLKDFGLVYDILIFERHLPQTLQFVDRHPDQVFVLDHAAKPRIKEGLLAPWQSNLTQLAQRPNVYCKVSGMVNEADWGTWSEEQLMPYFDIIFSAFGPKRLMFGSDWPMCLLATPYGRWFRLVEKYVARLSDTEQERFWDGTAVEAYGL